ncbi:MAG: hypothetical protein FWD57_11705 [Polyangiaceae bacterium]|nr:hypothetical protein [Polyangiaceae bacterium]
MSRESRPPGFDMSYRPKARRSFGPPMVSWIFPTVYLVFAMAFVGIVISTDLNVSSGWIYRYFVEGDDRRIIGVHTIAVFVMIGGIASMLRTKMRGVVIYGDGIGFRDVGNWGWPTVRNYGWAEIDSVRFESAAIALRLWDGTTQWLPVVADFDGMRRAIELVSVARGIPVDGVGLRPVEAVRADLEEGGIGG